MMMDRERETEGDRAPISKANPGLRLAGKTQFHTERVYNLLCPLCHMTVHPQVSSRPLAVCVCECLVYKRIEKRSFNNSDGGQNNKSEPGRENDLLL